MEPGSIQSPEKIWDWIDHHPQPSPRNAAKGRCPCEPQGRKRSSPHNPVMPKGGEIQRERRRAMEATAWLNGSGPGSLIQASEEAAKDSVSDSASSISNNSSDMMPHVTPGTVDDII
ncbi:hypothetical protein NDU88_003031 [Pleurodeles waltl]|uniref:Uncharacterized protein n=1 Tax=Pleurodeles waltl TaxID=8319 RepID=A0AAV7SEU0_PLEWA|nr:hypothetical protein NDU88_003031 [Pleurodeles waltl]